MKTWYLLPVLTAAVATSLAACAVGPEVEAKPYYYWLHPKLGPVKVERATNFMLVGPAMTKPAVEQRR